MNFKIVATVGMGVFAVFLLFAFQNCSESPISPRQLFQSRGNGEPYAGMQRLYQHFSPTSPCATDLNGKPTPNDSILFKIDSLGVLGPYLSRQSCQDVVPIALDVNEVTVTPDNTVVYNNQSFSTQNLLGPFDVIRPPCPSGKTSVPNPSLVNEFASPLDWTAIVDNGAVGTLQWYAHQGVGVNLYNTINGLPAFLVSRTDPNNLEYYYRVSQQVVPTANTDYAFTFLVQPGTVSGVDWNFFRNIDGLADTTCIVNECSRVIFDMKALTATVSYADNMINVTASITPNGSGFQCTVYFTSTATDNLAAVDMGIAPSTFTSDTGQVGDSVVATDAQLVPVSEICR